MRFWTRPRSEDRSDPAERRCGHGPSRGRAAARPRLEMLEGRRVLSTLTVTSNTDDPWGSTLRGEIAAAQPGDTIIFATGLQTITLGGSQLEISKNLTIQGPGSSPLAISGGFSRVFKVDAGANVTISGLTIEDGGGVSCYSCYNSPFGYTPDYYDGVGGGILNLGTLTLTSCTVTGNENDLAGANFSEGGGIGNLGTMTLSGCTVASNIDGIGGLAYSEFSYGGGVYNHGTMTLSGCNVTGNSIYTQGYSYALGGGVYNDGTMALSGSTVTGNSLYTQEYSFGGGIYNDGTLALSGSTVTDNTAGLAGTSFSEGGGIYNGGTMSLSGTVTNNTASAGGGIYNSGTMTLSGSTVTGNTATSGGGIFNDKQGNLTILSSVVLNNTASDGADICSLGSIKISKDSQVGKVSHK